MTNGRTFRELILEKMSIYQMFGELSSEKLSILGHSENCVWRNCQCSDVQGIVFGEIVDAPDVRRNYLFSMTDRSMFGDSCSEI